MDTRLLVEANIKDMYLLLKERVSESYFDTQYNKRILLEQTWVLKKLTDSINISMDIKENINVLYRSLENEVFTN